MSKSVDEKDLTSKQMSNDDFDRKYLEGESSKVEEEELKQKEAEGAELAHSKEEKEEEKIDP